MNLHEMATPQHQIMLFRDEQKSGLPQQMRDMKNARDIWYQTDYFLLTAINAETPW